MKQCQKSLDYMKQVITHSPISVYLDPDRQYYLFNVGSKHSWSGILIQQYDQVKENGTIINVPHPMLCQRSTFQRSQKNWSALTNEVYAINMSFCKMLFYLKHAHVKIRCDHVPYVNLYIQ